MPPSENPPSATDADPNLPSAGTPPVPEATPPAGTKPGGQSPEGSVTESPPPEGTAPPPPAVDDEYEPLTPELVEEDAIRGDFVLRWAVILLAFLLGSTRITETATLVHVKTGQYLAANGVLPPANDVFSYTAAERPWTNLAWGFDLVAAGIHAIGAFVGLSVFKALVAAIAFFVICGISRPGLPTWWGSICAALALLACHLRISAAPILMTYIGMALALAIVFHWCESPAVSKRLWLFVPLMLVWCNLDSRAWLGAAFLALFAAGDSVGALLKVPASLSAASRKEIWKVTGASVCAMLVNPYGWKSLAAPWMTYAVEYPAFRNYITEAYLESTPRQLSGPGISYFPMMTEAFWMQIDVAGVAALGLIVVTAATFILNRARIDWGQWAVYIGFVLMALACLHELPVAALVCCVLAALNGQAWYKAECRQSYSIEKGEILLSQGGRALTVLALAGIAFFAGTGRLRDSATVPARTGYGLDRNLELQLDDLREQLAGDASFDHRPFNTLMTQGDQMIWVGERVFVDSRVGLYYSEDDAEDILAQHLRTRDALRYRPSSDPTKPPADPLRAAWTRTFNRYNVTHVAMRLVNPQDFELFFDLVRDGEYWEWTNLGAVSAVFYRNRGVTDPGFKEFVAAHKIDFEKQAYADEDVDKEPGLGNTRDRSIRPKTFYQKYFWSGRRETSREIREAENLVLLMTSGALPPAVSQARLAMAFLAVRKAQAGLSKDPDNVNGYLVLGRAYDFLAKVEASASINGSHSARQGLRYLQCVAAFNQVLVGDPGNIGAHGALMQIYSEANRLDLAVRHIEGFEKALAARPDENSAALTNIRKQLEDLRERLDAVDEAIVKLTVREKDPLKIVGAYLDRGCVLRALRELELSGPALTGVLMAEQLRIHLLLEAGRVDDAYEAAGRFAGPAEQAQLPNWHDVVALANLPFADYKGASDHWRVAADDAERDSLNELLTSLALHDTRNVWPLGTTKAAFDVLYQRPALIASLRMNAALIYVEEGLNKRAARFFRDVLATNPETIHRSLAVYYLRHLSGGKEDLDLYPPSERVHELFAPEPGEEQPGEQDEGKKPVEE